MSLSSKSIIMNKQGKKLNKQAGESTSASAAAIEVFAPRSSVTAEDRNTVASGSLGFELATGRILAEGIKTLTTMNVVGEVDERVTDIALEMQNLMEESIQSQGHALTLKLREKREEMPCTVSGLKSIFDSITTVMKLKGNPVFLRYSSVEIIYTPLMMRMSEGNRPRIMISLVDTSMTCNGTIASVEFFGDCAAVTHLSMEYCVKAKDAQCIKLQVKADNVPIRGRDYAAIFALFKVHHTGLAQKYQRRAPIVVYLEDMEMPRDMNFKSVMGSVKNRLTEMSNREVQKRLMEREREMESVTDRAEFEVNQVEEDTRTDIAGLDHCGSDTITLLSKDDSETGVIKGGWILDSGATRHIISMASKEHVMTVKVLGRIVHGEIIAEMIVNIGQTGKLMMLQDVFISDQVDFNLISISALRKNDLIDNMELRDVGTTHLCVVIKDGIDVLSSVLSGDGLYYIE